VIEPNNFEIRRKIMLRGKRAGYGQVSGLGLNMFTSDELAELHKATLDVLQNAGVKVCNDEAREIFYSHGCKVDKKNEIVRIPPYLVDEAISSAPSEVLLAGRNPEHDIVLGGNRVGFSNFQVGIEMLDIETGKVRESTLRDVAETAILCDALDGVDIFTQAISARDIPTQVADLVGAETCLLNTSKHVHMGEILTADGVRTLFEMGVAIAGSAEEMRQCPPCSVAICPVSPLQLGPQTCEVIIESARIGMVCNIAIQALAGATAPVTLAGALIVGNAEALAGIVLSQLTNKGAPIIYGSSTTILDMAVVNAPVGCPELALLSAGVAKLAQYYNIPSYVAGT